jgi:uroporphyrin-III C-methyltransferase
MSTEKVWLSNGLMRIQQFLFTHNFKPFNPLTHLPNWSNSRFSHNQAFTHQKHTIKGHVYLVGAGPGDAELLTLKAYRLIQQADVVMYDWLVDSEIINMIPKHVERVFVGKKCGRHSMQQGDICQLMAEVALAGKNIVRLKGGDPAIFARAAEECDILTQYQIEFAIVPGITAASGASAYAGIPLTHRDCAQSVRFVTAHLKSVKDEPNWPALVVGANASHGETLVFYMGLKRIATIMQRLETHGLAKNTPVAVIDQASTTKQQICIGQLDTISDKVLAANFQGPAITIVGQVVNKRQNINLALLSKEGLKIAG